MSWPVLLMVRSLGIGGTERQVAYLARGLDRRRFSPHVACFHTTGFRNQDLMEAGVPLLRLPVKSMRGPSAIRGAFLLRQYVRRHGIVLVHTFDSPMNLFGVPAARASRVPVVLSSARAYRDLMPPFSRRLLRVADRMADGVVVNCEALRRRLMEDEGLAADRALLCYNALEFDDGEPERGAGPVVGIVCALRQEKDIRTLLHAFARIRPEFPGAKLAIIGDGPVRGEIEAERAALGLDGACEMPGAVRNVGEWLRKIDVFVLPSVSEALSNSLMEAMAAGCCAIASRVGGNPELVSHLETGLLFPPGDAGALAGQLRRVLGDAAERGQLAAAGQAFVRSRFSLDAACTRMGEIYREILGRKLVKA